MASIWNPGTDNPLDPSGHPKVQRFVATEGQTVFTLTTFSYVLATGSLLVEVAGALQVVNVGFTETSTTSFTLSEACEAGDVVVALGY